MPDRPPFSSFRDGLRLLDGLSLAAVRAFFSGGPADARKVIGSTLAALHPPRNPWLVTPWDVMRAFATPQPIVVNGGDWTDGTTAPLERLLIAALLRHFAPHAILEIGTYRGVTTRLLLDNLPPDARIHTIDLPPAVDPAELTAASDARLIIHRQLGVEFRGHPLADRVTQILGDTFAPATWAQVPEGIEFAFIDASHSYEAVRNDTEKLRPKLTPDAVVIWHDYSEKVTSERGVGLYLRELFSGDPSLFICEGTQMAFRVPVAALKQGAERIPTWYPDGDYAQKEPDGVPAWRR